MSGADVFTATIISAEPVAFVRVHVADAAHAAVCARYATDHP